MSVISTAAIGIYDDVICLDKTIKSGLIPYNSQANLVPVLPKPLITSSAMIKISYLLQTACIFFQYPSGGTIRPPAPMTGSPINAAIVSGSSFKISFSSSLAHRVENSSSLSPSKPSLQ